jgi:HAD superfamily hydrolase (TIGR01490 family)
VNLTLFDLDGTLLPIDSEHARRNDAFFLDYQAGRLDMPAYIDFATAAWRDRPTRELEAASRRFMQEIIVPALRDSARALVERHRARGDKLAVVTATNDFVTGPIARAFGIDDLIATELERDPQGRITGRIRGVPALREGKITRVQQWLDSKSMALGQFDSVTFYSDSTNDLPLLEQVSHPVATNPGPALAEIAAARGWPILKLFE